MNLPIANLYTDDPVEDRPGVRWAGPLAEAPADADRWGDALAIWSCEPATVRVEDPGCAAIDGVCDGDVLVDEVDEVLKLALVPARASKASPSGKKPGPRPYRARPGRQVTV